MFDELIPPELREALCACSDTCHDLERTIGWACVAGHIPERFERYVLDSAARMRRVALEVLVEYRRRDLTLEAAIRRIESECDVDRLDPPDADLVSRRSSAPPDMF